MQMCVCLYIWNVMVLWSKYVFSVFPRFFSFFLSKWQLFPVFNLFEYVYACVCMCMYVCCFWCVKSISPGILTWAYNLVLIASKWGILTIPSSAYKIVLIASKWGILTMPSSAYNLVLIASTLGYLLFLTLSSYHAYVYIYLIYYNY